MFEIVSIALTVVGWIVAGVSAVYTLIKRKKINSITDEKEKAEEFTRVESAKLKIVEKIPEYCKRSELLCGQKSGFTKLNLVTQWIQIDCLTEAIPYDADYFRNQIEMVLSAPEKKTTSN